MAITNTFQWLAVLFAAVLVVGCAGAPSLSDIDDRGTHQSDTAKSTIQDGKQPKPTVNAKAYKGKLRVVKALPPPPGAKSGYGLAVLPDDLLEISFFGVEKLDRKVRVDSIGIISMPLVGKVKAGGKTVRQLESDLKQVYGRNYLQSPQISVNVKESSGQRVAVDGEVNSPGLYPVTPRSTLLRAITLARGFSKIGDPSKVFLFRNMGSNRLVAQYSIEAIRAGRQPDPQIYGGDVIVTFPSAGKVAIDNLKTALGLATRASALSVMGL